jgi:flavorubredoxin
MSEIIYSENEHQNILLEDYGNEQAVQANVHLIAHKGKSMILDPGGHRVFNKAMSKLSTVTKINDLEYIFLSHQDPDIVAAVNGWLMSTEAEAICSDLWLRFVPHFGVDRFVIDRLKGIPDEGKVLDLNGCELLILPAHFLHSLGNFQVYDPISKILYTGDLGASLGASYSETSDFDSHIQYIEGFHQRYMTCNAVMQAWAAMIRQLEIDVIAPQHGARLTGDAVPAFISWCENLHCGLDLIIDKYQIPG